MNPKIFAEWLKEQNYQVYQTESGFWFNQGPGVYQSFPYHKTIQPTPKELEQLMVNHGIIGLRYSAPIDSSEGQISYHVMCEERPYCIESVPNRIARQDIRRGLRYASIEPIPLSRLAVDGWKLRASVLSRQGRKGAESQEWWEKLCRTAEGLPGFEAWGAIHEHELISSLLCFTCDDCFMLLYQQSSDDQFKYGINNSLFFTVVSEALNRTNIRKVFIALHSLDAPPSVDKFKFRMGFKAQPVRQRVIFNPLITPLINPLTYSGLNTIHKILPSVSALSKAEGMLRFHLKGKYPLIKQDWPEGLLDQKEQLLARYATDTNLSANLPVQPAHTR